MKNVGLLVKCRQCEKQFRLEHMESVHHPMDRNRIELVQISKQKLKKKKKEAHLDFIFADDSTIALPNRKKEPNIKREICI